MDKRKVIYYGDELNDEFSLKTLTPRKVDGSYAYCRDTAFKKFTRVFWYRIVAMPLAFLYTKLKFAHKKVGVERLKKCKSGYFMYGNHTQDIGDALIPNMLDGKKGKYIVVHPNNLNVPVIGKLTPSLGALPLPGDGAAYKNFIAAIEKRVAQKKGVVIYPEAHIWPFYTKIRPFTSVSFHYPAKLGAPVFCFTNTYQKRALSKKPKIVTYVDGPFIPDASLPLAARKQALRDAVYNAMCERAKLSTVEQIKYIKREEGRDDG